MIFSRYKTKGVLSQLSLSVFLFNIDMVHADFLRQVFKNYSSLRHPTRMKTLNSFCLRESKYKL